MMKINILRGQDQIGGSIIEISTATTRLILDAGVELDEGEQIMIPEIGGLFSGEKAYDAVFVSHYHADHMGLLNHVLKGIPIYMGEKAYRIASAASEYLRREISFVPNFILDEQPITIGDIQLTPISCDHSAFDAYMFLIEVDGKTLLYTGDFRANGRLGDEELLKTLSQVDGLIIEGTTLSREDDRENIEEEFLEEIAVNYLDKHNGPAFVWTSAMNIDRIITAYNIAERSGRVFLEDIYTASVATAAGSDIPQPNGKYPARVFTTGGDRQYELLQQFGAAKIGKKAIAKQPFVMCVRPSMKSYLSKLNELCSFEDGVLFYAMWKGYLEQPSMQTFVDFMESKGVRLHMLHTSGHADAQTIDRLVSAVCPKVIVPVHTENASWFDRYKNFATIIHAQKQIEI